MKACSNPNPHDSASGTGLHAFSGQKRLEELLITTTATYATFTRRGAARLPASVQPLLAELTPRKWWGAALPTGFLDRQET